MPAAWFELPALVRCPALKALAFLLAGLAPAQEPAPNKARAVGRCLAAETLAPLKGVTVQAGSLPNSYVIKDATTKRTGLEAQTVSTDGEGRFTLDFDAPNNAHMPLTVLASVPGRAPRAGTWSMVRPGDTLDVGDVELSVGFTLRGKVVDPDGAPVAGEGLWVPRVLDTLKLVPGAPDTLRPGSTLSIRVTGLSDEKGEFTFNAPLAAGTWDLALVNPRNRLKEPARLKVDAESAAEPLTIVVDVARAAERKAAGAAGNLSFELTVVEKGTGKPIEDFGVRCDPGRLLLSTDLLLDGHHEGGRVMVDGISSVAHVLQVVPRDPCFARSARVNVRARDGKIAPVRIELDRLQAYAFVVQRDDGTPVGGTTCELCDARGGVVDLKTRFSDESRLPVDLPARGPALVATTRSDDAGRVVLHGQRDTKDLRLRVLGPGHLATVVVVEAAGDAPQRIVVRSGATIEGTVGPAALAALWQPKLDLRPPNSPTSSNPARNAVGIDNEGRFRFENVESGALVVQAVMVVTMHRGTSRQQSPVRLHGTERTVEVGANGKVEVGIDLAAWTPATLEGIVSEAASAKVTGVVVLAGERVTERWLCGAFALDATGRFRIQGLPPGKYRLQWYRDEQATHPLVHADEVEFAPGKTVPHEFHFDKQ